MTTLRKGAYIPGTSQYFNTSGTSAATANPVGASTTIIRIAVTQDTWIVVGPTPVAGSGSLLIPGGGVEFIAVTPGVDKVAGLQVTTAGIVSVTELV